MPTPTNKKLHLALLGENGNAYNLLALFANAAKRAKWAKEEIDSVLDEARSGDYDHLLKTLQDRTCSNGFECTHEEEFIGSEE